MFGAIRVRERAGAHFRIRRRVSDDEVLAQIWASHGEGAVKADALNYWPCRRFAD